MPETSDDLRATSESIEADARHLARLEERKQALSPDAMLAYGMDGKALTAAHGFPARVVMPRMYGYKNVKWVTRIELETNYDRIGYWEQRGYDKDAWVGRSNGAATVY